MTIWPFVSASTSAGANPTPGWRRIVSMALTAVVVASLGWGTDAAVRAQIVAPSEPSVVVTGIGTATAPAATATVQLVIGRGGREFGFSEDAQGGSSFESAGAFAEDNGFVAALVAEDDEGAAATPVAMTDGGAATPEARRRGRDMERAERPRRLARPRTLPPRRSISISVPSPPNRSANGRRAPGSSWRLPSRRRRG